MAMPMMMMMMMMIMMMAMMMMTMMMMMISPAVKKSKVRTMSSRNLGAASRFYSIFFLLCNLIN